MPPHLRSARRSYRRSHRRELALTAAGCLYVMTTRCVVGKRRSRGCRGREALIFRVLQGGYTERNDERGYTFDYFQLIDIFV